jgi:alkanesulfonate monooxygenase SsuD/methylene tetrahydromethanopterin reductase-like flavin-dependent oxidoreductase (luciferase family)
MHTDILLVPMGARYPDLRAAAVAADEAGFAGLWTWDHLRDPDLGADSRVPEAWTLLSALAEVTRRLMLGPLVLNVGNRHPGLLANMAATLQEVSGGRVLLGIGAGGSRRTPYAAEQEALGLAVEPDAVRAQRVVEAAQVMRRLWAGDASDFAGTHYRLARPTGFLRADPPPPIIVGGFGPRMAAIAGRWGDGLNTQAMHPDLDGLVRVARAEHAASGRDPARFCVTVFARLDSAWVQPGTGPRRRLAGLGVERLILLAVPPLDPHEIRAAGALISRASAAEP